MFFILESLRFQTHNFDNSMNFNFLSTEHILGHEGEGPYGLSNHWKSGRTQASI